MQEIIPGTSYIDKDQHRNIYFVELMQPRSDAWESFLQDSRFKQGILHIFIHIKIKQIRQNEMTKPNKYRTFSGFWQMVFGGLLFFGAWLLEMQSMFNIPQPWFGQSTQKIFRCLRRQHLKHDVPGRSKGESRSTWRISQKSRLRKNLNKDGSTIQASGFF